MIYNFETYYREKIDLFLAVKTIALFIVDSCEFYEAEIIIPNKNYVGSKNKHGKLPAQNRQKFISEIINWLFENSEGTELFKLFLYNNPIDQIEPRMFDHHDDSCCWALNINPDQFEGLKKSLKKNKLPEDLFFDSSKSVYVKSKGILGFFGFNKCYTPKEYETLKK